MGQLHRGVPWDMALVRDPGPCARFAARRYGRRRSTKPHDRSAESVARDRHRADARRAARGASARSCATTIVLGEREASRSVGSRTTTRRRRCCTRWCLASTSRSSGIRSAGVHTGVDLGSSNGSAVDGIPANVKLALRDGSVLRVGPAAARLRVRRPSFRRRIPREVSRDAIPGRAAAARQLREDVARAAPDPSPVLLTGATGTGKEFDRARDPPPERARAASWWR